MPSSLVLRGNSITNYLFGINTQDDKKLLSEILRDTDPTFFKWAINAITKWRNNVDPNGVVIHGSKDGILSKTNDVQHVIEGGGHFMIVNRAKEISKILEKELHEMK